MSGLERTPLTVMIETPAELAARRRELQQAVAALADAPVQHVPAAFLAAVEGLFPDLAMPPAPAPAPALRALS